MKLLYITEVNNIMLTVEYDKHDSYSPFTGAYKDFRYNTDFEL